MSKSPNLGYLFYFRYFRDEHLKSYGSKWLDLEKKSKSSAKEDQKHVTQFFHTKIQEITTPKLEDYEPLILDGVQHFTLKTTYPGLLIGSGYTHEVNLLNELKLGFYFDHTSGLPYIPGSSIKGIIRSAFLLDNGPAFLLEIWQNARENALAIPDAQRNEWEKIECAFNENLTEQAIDQIEREIFGSRIIQKSENEDAQMGRDIFHDAVPVRDSGKFLATDFITPHINRKNRALDPFTDPTPLQFLKVGPDVSFRFQFETENSISTGITKVQKTALFRQILLHLGAGAKTNVGYGQFTQP